MMKLSIIILTIDRNRAFLDRLLSILNPQIDKYRDDVEIIIIRGEVPMTRGEKRNNGLRIMNGKRFCFIDDDDVVPDYYVEEIMKAIEKDPDVITFKGYMLTDGKARVNFVIQLGEKYEERDGVYYRWPNHLTVMRKDRVKDFHFLPIHMGEDYEWSKRIHDAGVLQTEEHINACMYIYEFISNK